MSLSKELMDKIKKAADESFEEYSSGFSELDSDKLFETAYLHGYNCANNIYDVAEEKVDGMIKEGESPIKDVPAKSIDVKENSRNYLRNNINNISDLDNKEIYEYGYGQGFKNAWETYITTDLTDGLQNLTNYYLSGNRNSKNL